MNEFDICLTYTMIDTDFYIAFPSVAYYPILATIYIPTTFECIEFSPNDIYTMASSCRFPWELSEEVGPSSTEPYY